MLSHRKRLLKLAVERQDTEGLNTTVYTRHSVTQFPLYTWIKVSINMTRVLQTAPKNMQHIGDQLLKHFLSTETKSIKV
ncbi:unnamed protein product [Candidula unifasciata]|uniref:Uncharacterized protein n=1 Tax=Candidula unifasciata TaxID=100452 RepID=A0A8S3YHV1_9EUPU|nr:unnamed protein product [Candidula unifasciata]